jgi:hypothetical protein
VKYTNTYKVISIALSFLVLFSTFSLTIEKHFCGDVLIDVAIFSESEKCGAIEVSKQQQADIAILNCCKDEIDVIEGLSEITLKSFEDLETIEQNVLFAYTFCYISLFSDLPNLNIPHKDYSAPIRIKDIQVLDETYLI